LHKVRRSSTCLEFNNRGEDPCTNIWLIYIIFCKHKPHELLRLLRCSGSDGEVQAELKRLVSALLNSKKRQSQRYPSFAKYGKEFMEMYSPNRRGEVYDEAQEGRELYQSLCEKECS
jgi:hypothetical protein